MLAITDNSAYKICFLSDNSGCIDSCSSGNIFIDSHGANFCGTKCPNYILIPNGICIDECDENIFHSNDSYHCGFCIDIDSNNPYKLLNSSGCLNEIPSTAYLYNEKYKLLKTKLDIIIPTYSETPILNEIPSSSSIYHIINSYQNCIYYDSISKTCFLNQNNNEGIYNYLSLEILPNYSIKDGNIIIKGEESDIFQITTSKNELDSLNNNNENKMNLSVIDLGECESIIKKENNLDDNDTLIIIKFEKITNISSQRNIQYEVYNPNNKQKLNLDPCNITNININYFYFIIFILFGFHLFIVILFFIG